MIMDCIESIKTCVLSNPCSKMCAMTVRRVCRLQTMSSTLVLVKLFAKKRPGGLICKVCPR